MCLIFSRKLISCCALFQDFLSEDGVIFSADIYLCIEASESTARMTEYLTATDSSMQADARTEYFEPNIFPIEENIILQQVEPIEVHIEHTDVSENAEPAEDRVMIEQFELAQGARGSLPRADLDRYCRVIKLRNAQPSESPIVADCSELGRDKFIRFSSESFPDLKGPQLEFLSELCLTAHRSEEFFLSVAKNQWVRTSVASDKAPQELFSPTLKVEERCKLISSITIHSNVLPRDPFWTNIQATRNDASKRVHFPCAVFKEALHEGNTLMQKLQEWRMKKEACEIGQHGLKRSVDGNTRSDPSRLFWDIRADVTTLKQFAKGSDGTVWLVRWRGGLFVRKDRTRTSNINDNSDPRDAIDTELNVVEQLSHPHMVYSFGVSYAVNKSSLFMEYMQGDLSQLILDRVRDTGDNEPPFSHQDSVDILLQFAKAMAHMHGESVVHGDLKAHNILVSEVLISENVKRYLVKVADFGSAQFVSSNPESTDFKPGAATTKYAAPEVLRRRVDKNVDISLPKALDVYSYGIVAFEVLTGEELYANEHSQRKMKEDIISGKLRPPLREDCEKENFLHDDGLLSLIESCWHGDPSKRPSFPKIVKELTDIRAQILKPTSCSGRHRRQGKFVDDTSNCALKEPAPVINSHHPSRVPLQVHATCTEGRSKSVFNLSTIFQR
ncbi:hypothetical protein M758_12G032300 [Ceratodon purpureus]|nr:hypothetical protein M758_12G032300 [Ceratodon purpureus]